MPLQLAKLPSPNFGIGPSCCLNSESRPNSRQPIFFAATRPVIGEDQRVLDACERAFVGEFKLFNPRIGLRQFSSISQLPFLPLNKACRSTSIQQRRCLRNLFCRFSIHLPGFSSCSTNCISSPQPGSVANPRLRDTSTCPGAATETARETRSM